MTFSIIVSALVIASAVAAGLPAFAQTSGLDTEEMAQACAISADACMIAANAAIAALDLADLTPAAYNAELGVLAAAVVKAGQALPSVEKLSFSTVIKEIALASKDAAQREALMQVASSFETESAGGGTSLLVTETPLSDN